MSDGPFMLPPPRPMTPEKARDVSRAYMAMAQHLSELDVGEAGLMERNSQRWLAYAIALAQTPPKAA